MYLALMIMFACEIVAGLTLVAYYRRCRRRGEAVADWPTVEGDVVESAVRHWKVHTKGGERPRHQARVAFRYRVGAREFTSDQLQYCASDTSLSEAQQIVDDYPAEKSIRVYYNPDNPEEAYLKPGLHDKRRVLEFLGWGIIGSAAVVGLVMYLVFSGLPATRGTNVGTTASAEPVRAP